MALVLASSIETAIVAIIPAVRLPPPAWETDGCSLPRVMRPINISRPAR